MNPIVIRCVIEGSVLILTRILPADKAATDEAARLIRAGEVVAFPTETVYGLGANALDGDAVGRIFTAKGRPADNPLIVHIAAMDDLGGLAVRIPGALTVLADAFWPGPLTLVVPRDGRVPDSVTAGLDTVAVRMPAHPCARALIAASGVPIAAPSANRSGRPSPTQARHVLEDMDGRMPLILDGGPCEGGVESTVLDISGGAPVLLRPGLVTLEELEEALGTPVAVGKGVMEAPEAGAKVRSPGLKHRHYAPNARVYVVAGGVEHVLNAYRASTGKTLILAPNEHAPDYAGCDMRPLGALSDPRSTARALFAALREADADGYETILFEEQPGDGVGLAVMNRILRAADFSYHTPE